MTLDDAVSKVRNQNVALFAEADSHLKSRVFLPGLIIMYSAVDGLAWLGSPDGPGRGQIGANFQDWVRRYVLVHGEHMTTRDFWAARCAVLHTQTADSDLSEAQKARVIWYRLPNEQATVQAFAATMPLIVNPRNLVEKARRGMETWLEDVKRTPAVHHVFCGRADRLFNETVITNPGHTSQVMHDV
jgi:phage gp37-like protein